MSPRLQTSRAVCLLVIVLALRNCAGISAAESASIPDGFRRIFDGKTLDGWHGRPHVDPKTLADMTAEEREKQLHTWTEEAKLHWRVENGELVNDGEGPYLTTNEEFGDIEFLIEYRTVAKADSGIYLRGTPQVQIWDFTREGEKWNRGADKGAGGLFNNAPGSISKEPLVFADKPFGEWNQFRIVQVGARTSVWLNGQRVVDHAILENFWNRSRPLDRVGPLQLQTHGGEIRWRNLFLREIPSEEANRILGEHQSAGFESIFNGSDLTGWAGDVDNYQVVDGSIVCREGKGGNLFTAAEYDDFVVRLEFRLPPAGNNGLAIRYPGTGRPSTAGMTEIQILDSEHDKYKGIDARQHHGSAYGMVPAHRGYLRPTGEWNFHEVRVAGSRVTVDLNGSVILDANLSEVTEFKDNEPHPGKDLKRGHFGFAGHSDPVEFRNIRIRKLKPLEAASSWPQFRGPSGNGRADIPAGVPAEISPEKNVIWKSALPPGHSSPVVFGNRIFLTAEKKKSVGSGDTPAAADAKTPSADPAATELLTMCLDRSTGAVLWEQTAPHEKLEEVHEIGSRAQCTPATDGEHVVSFFGSSGLYCYDLDGKELWRRRMGPFNDTFGAGASPIIVDGRVILVQDHDTDSFLMSLDVNTGEILWKTDRSEFPRSYSTPVILTVEGKKQIVVAGTLRVIGYDFQTGKEVWTVRGLSRAVCSTPVVSHDNLLIVAGWSRGGDVNETIHVDPFDQVISAKDTNKNGTLEDPELEKGGDVQQRFSQVDRDKSGSITKEEYEYYRTLFATARNVLLAVRPGGTGDITKTHQLWESRKFVPFCASPLACNGYVFTVKDGGIATCYNATTGELLKTKRLSGNNSYYSSPVSTDGRIYTFDQRGKLSVIGAYADWAEIWNADFGEDVYATPAIADDRIYVRTTGHLYCFGNAPKAKAAPESKKPASAAQTIFRDGSSLEELWNEGEFTEGVAVRSDGLVFFSDIPSDPSTDGRILRCDPESGMTEVACAASGKSNGLVFDAQDRLFACCGANGGRRALCEVLPSGSLKPLAGKYMNQPLNAPNDLVIHPSGAIYFSDPRYLGPEPLTQPGMWVYRFDPASGMLTVATKELRKPNGVEVSPDGKTLYVAETDNGISGAPGDPARTDGQMLLTAFDIADDGTLSNRRVLRDFGKETGIDGMAVSPKGLIFAAVRAESRHGIAVFDAAGDELDFLPTDSLPTNCALGKGASAGKLYITAGGGLYQTDLSPE